MKRGYRINPNTSRAKIMPENLRRIRLVIEDVEPLICPGRLEERLSRLTGLGKGSVDKTLRRRPQLRLLIAEKIENWFIRKILLAIDKGCNTVSAISRKTGLKRDKIRGVLNRSNRWTSLPANERSVYGRLRAGQRKGSQTRTARTIEKIFSASSKNPRSLNALAKEAGISPQWLQKLRETQPVVDKIALSIVSKQRPLTAAEKARLLKGRILLLKQLNQRVKKRAAEIQAEIDAELEG